MEASVERAFDEVVARSPFVIQCLTSPDSCLGGHTHGYNVILLAHNCTRVCQQKETKSLRNKQFDNARRFASLFGHFCRLDGVVCRAIVSMEQVQESPLLNFTQHMLITSIPPVIGSAMAYPYFFRAWTLCLGLAGVHSLEIFSPKVIPSVLRTNLVHPLRFLTLVFLFFEEKDYLATSILSFNTSSLSFQN